MVLFQNELIVNNWHGYKMQIIDDEAEDILDRKRKNNQKWFLIITLFLIAIISAILLAKEVFGYEEPIGIINISDEYLMAWNQGRIANTTFFNRTTGLLQIANSLDRTKDVTYLMGYSRKTGSTYTFLAINDPLVNEVFSTDYLTYYYASTSKNISGVYLKRNYSQMTNDDYVKITYTLISRQAILGNHYFASRLSNLDIGSDGIYETIELQLANGSTMYLWDDNGTITYDNVLQLKIYGSQYSFILLFPSNVTIQYNRSGNTTNGDITILKNIGTLAANTEYNVSYFWIDAECTHACPRSCAVTLSGNNTAVSYPQSSGGKYYCKWVSFGFGCGTGGCNLTPDCAIGMTVRNTNGNLEYITNTSTDRTVRSVNLTAKNVSPVSGVTYVWDFMASKIGNEEWLCHVGLLPLNISVSIWVSNWTTTGSGIKIKLNNPENRTVTADQSVYFNCSSNTTIDNITMWVNTTLNYTQNNANLSTNIYFANNFYSNWTCKGCYSHNCDNTSAGINWLRVNITLDVAVTPSLYSYIFLVNRKTDKNNWLWWWM